MKRARVAIIHPHLRVGGGSEACALWAVEALKEKHCVSLISGAAIELAPFNDFYHTSLDPNEIKLVTVAPPAGLRNPDRFAAMREFRLARYCRRVAPEFDVMFSTYSPMDFGKPGIQYVLDPHFNQRLLAMLNPTPSALRRTFYRDSIWRQLYLGLSEKLSGFSLEGMKANLTLVDSNWTGTITRDFYGLETQTVYPPVLSEYPVIPWGDREDGFICLGRVVPQKQIERAVEIIGSVRRFFPRLHLHVLGRVGDDAYADSLRRLASEKPEWLFIEGDLTWKKKAEFLTRHKYGIHAKENEPFGIAVAEMACAGCLVWVPNGGGQVEIVDHPELTYSGLEDGRKKIVRALRHEDLRNSLRRHLIRQARRFSVTRYKDEIREVVEDFLVAGPRRNRMTLKRSDGGPGESRPDAIKEPGIFDCLGVRDNMKDIGVPRRARSARPGLNRTLTRATRPKRPSLAIVIATRNRAFEIRRLLTSLTRQLRPPDLVIIVDSSEASDPKLAFEFPRLRIEHYPFHIASASRQRNYGLRMLNKRARFVGFLDDDDLLEPHALSIAANYLASSPWQLAGASLNMINHPELDFESFKHLRLAERLGLYCQRAGSVLPSGFQTMIGYVKRNTLVEWLPSGAVFWKRKILDDIRFDEWYADYSYLEDLDLSYRIGKEYKLAVLAHAKYYHAQSPTARVGGFQFGKKEVLNRVHFVRKNRELSAAKCYLALGARLGISFLMFLRTGGRTYLQRILGNLAGFGAAVLMRDNG